MIFIFLSSGLFLGWSLGANDAANIFGTAVGTKMVRFKIAALIASVFVILGAVIGGAGATHTLGKLGAVNAIAGAFMVAFSAAFTVFMMTKYKLPVSTSQAIVGSIIGWNFYAQVVTDASSLEKILSTWVLCPLLSALFAGLLYLLTRWVRSKVKISLLGDDMRTRIGLILIGAFGAYSLGANNIANVMGVFVSAEPFGPLDFFGLFTLSGAQVLFLIGAIAISVGIITYSHKVMDTVGESLLKLSPITALIVVLSESLVLFIFSSQSLQAWLISHNLPAIPLVPVSSSQAVVGAVIGIGLIKSRHQIRLNVLGEIAAGWVTTPVIAGLITFVFLFFLQNVFNQKVYEEIHYQIDQQVVEYLSRKGIPPEKLEPFTEKEYKNEVSIYEELKESGQFSGKEILEIVSASKIAPLWIDPEKLDKKLDRSWLSKEEVAALYKISGKHYRYHWQLTEDLMKNATAWHFKEKTVLNNEYNKSMKAKYDYIFRLFEEKVKQDN